MQNQTTVSGPYSSVHQIMSANAAAGQFFFEPATMRFFKSRVLAGVIKGRYFITSERGPGMPRLYTIREALATGEVETVGGHQEFSTADAARRVAATLPAEGFSSYDERRHALTPITLTGNRARRAARAQGYKLAA